MVNLDVLVIGAGTAGEYAAGTAVQSADPIGMIEKGPVGGDCIFHAYPTLSEGVRYGCQAIM